MKTLRILVAAFLGGVLLASCKSVTAVCLATEPAQVDTIGWVIRPPADTVGPMTATASCGVEVA